MDTVRGSLKIFEVATGYKAAFEDGKKDVAETFFRVDRLEQRILTKVLVQLDLNTGGENGSCKVVELLVM